MLLIIVDTYVVFSFWSADLLEDYLDIVVFEQW